MLADALHVQERVDEALLAIRSRTTLAPRVALILGTGLGGLAEAMEISCTVSYADLPCFPVSTVESHAGRLLFGTLNGVPVMAMQGRFHRYEGYTLQQVTFPVRVLRALGAQTLIVSNACGGMHPLWAPGDLMVIADHLNLLGDSPLIGPNDDRLGARFPDLSEAYDGEWRALAHRTARALGLALREGVYAAVPGPNLESRAEYRMLRQMGGDVVGMSTVPEVIVARHAGMRVLGLSLITDQCLPDALEEATLEKILAVAARAEPSLTALVSAMLPSLAAA